ncbi:uncharacterized protein LOC121911426 isoform X2 [Thunnus maccoyii]|uniref:uncharacterized protein LOC121911426 isoform X2 n=1 Tax=Thunnus maccoyii TaxID=8240 RepID=UPI001C4B995D|nr:uncharacterized protein LOC121911426 isoform X2 [Thunnus maccoyii]
MFSGCHYTAYSHVRSCRAESFSKKMDLKRRLYYRVYFILLFVWGNISTAAHLSGVENETSLNLDCSNDGKNLMFCHFQSLFEKQSCTEYNLTISYKLQEKSCIFQQCDIGCCCSLELLFVLGEIHTANVSKGGTTVVSKNIDIIKSIKPRVPTISVEEINGNFQVTWDTNMSKSFRDYMNIIVTYHKKGDSKEVSRTVKALSSYEIRGQDLEPSTTYVVSVKSNINLSGLFSDSSKELEFTTSASRHALLSAVIICLSIAAVIITSVALGCFEILKAKWRDTLSKCPNPELLDIHPGEQKVLKLLQTNFSSVSIDTAVVNNSEPRLMASLTESSSGMSTGSSFANIEPADIKAGVQDALSKAFTHISPRSSVTAPLLTESNKDSDLLSATYNPCVTADDLKNSPQSTDFDNMTYLIRIPSCQIMMNNSEMFCDSVYHPSEGDMMTCPDKQAPVCPDPVQQNVILPAVVSSLMPTDMSYQCSPDKQVPVQDGQYLSDDQRPFLSFISANPSTPIITDSDYHSV